MSPDRPVVYILGTFPQPSQTFIAREVRGLKQLGAKLLVFALARRGPDLLDEVDRAWYQDISFVPRALAPSVVAANLRCLLAGPRRYLRTGFALARLDHRPRILALRAPILFMRAAWIADAVRRAGGCRQVHAHFALAQTEVAMAIAGLLDVPYSFTAHARDIYATPSALEEKIRRASFVVSCTQYNVDFLRRLVPDVPPDRIHLVHHGVDLDIAVTGAAAPQGGRGSETPLLLAAGRLVEKKGFDTLIDACAGLRQRDVRFRCRICGAGPLERPLRARIAAAGLQEVVELPGWIPSSEIATQLRQAAVFAMPSRVGDRGDRDGIPNVVLEAMAAGVPVVATRVSGIPEAVIDGETGLLVAPDAPADLANALHRLLADAQLRARFGAAARARAAEEFSLQISSERLGRIFEQI